MRVRATMAVRWPDIARQHHLLLTPARQWSEERERHLSLRPSKWTGCAYSRLDGKAGGRECYRYGLVVTTGLFKVFW